MRKEKREERERERRTDQEKEGKMGGKEAVVIEAF